MTVGCVSAVCDDCDDGKVIRDDDDDDDANDVEHLPPQVHMEIMVSHLGEVQLRSRATVWTIYYCCTILHLSPIVFLCVRF